MDEKYIKIIISLGLVLGGFIIGYYAIIPFHSLRLLPFFSVEYWNNGSIIFFAWVIIPVFGLVLLWAWIENSYSIEDELRGVWMGCFISLYIFCVAIGYFISIGYFPLILNASIKILIGVTVLAIIYFTIKASKIIAEEVNSRNYYETSVDPGWLSANYYNFVSLLREFTGKPRVWIIPKYVETYKEHTLRANSLYFSIKKNLVHTPVSEAKKIIFKDQSYQTLRNINKAIWKRDRCQVARDSIKQDTEQAKQLRIETNNMMDKLNQEVNRSLDILSTVSVSLLNVEFAHGEVEFDRLLNVINNSNKRLRALAEAYMDSKKYSN